MLVRVATEDDLDAVARLNGAVQALHHERRPDWFVPPDLPATRAWLAEMVERDDVFVVVAEEDGHVVGYALATLHRRPANPFTRARSILELDQIGVDQDARRSGVGTMLIRHVADHARRLSVDHLMLTVWEFNDVARATFRSRGFVDAVHRMELAEA